MCLQIGMMGQKREFFDNNDEIPQVRFQHSWGVGAALPFYAWL